MTNRRRISLSPCSIRPTAQSGIQVRKERSITTLLEMAPLLDEIAEKMGGGIAIRFQDLNIYSSSKFQQMSAADLHSIEYELPVVFDDCEVSLFILRSSDIIPGKVAKMAMLGEISAGIIHDVNNLLTAISFSLDEIKHELPMGMKEVHDDAMLATDSCKLACERIMRFSTSGNFSKPEPLRSIVEAAIGILRPIIKRAGSAKEIRIVTDVDPVFCVRAVASDVEFAIMNIIQNAINHGIKEKGEVRISASDGGNETMLHISNDGTKIPDSVSVVLGKRPLSKDLDHGYGIYVSKLALVGSGGDLTFESNEERTTFTITLPSCTDE